jgi:hypothetical protein
MTKLKVSFCNFAYAPKKTNHKIAAGPGSKELWSLSLALGPELKS